MSGSAPANYSRPQPAAETDAVVQAELVADAAADAREAKHRPAGVRARLAVGDPEVAVGLAGFLEHAWPGES
ncbi:hypothetical protein ACFY5F_29625 [Streptomyces sp. NPDC013161]|uniref:hypothetical protein n=1 Tax=Streptomyces sp. NPDC013161 TaxID=3364862 RepID=UPI00367DB597